MTADGDPADVLAAYHQLLSAGRDGDASAPDQNAREWGTREVTIEASRLIGPDGPTERFLSGQAMTIEMDVRAMNPVATPNFGVAIHTVDGAHIYGTNTRIDSLSIERLSGSATVSFSIDRLPLHEGRFVVTLAVHSQDESTIYHWLDRHRELSVFQRSTGVGPVNLSGSWQVRTGSTEGTSSVRPLHTR